MTYKVIFHRRCNKFLAKIGRKQYDAIIEKLDELAENPLSENLNIKKLRDSANLYRLRIGNVRAAYSFDPKEKTIFVHEIDFRGNIY